MINLILDTNSIYDYVGRDRINVEGADQNRENKLTEIIERQSTQIIVSELSIIEATSKLEKNYNALSILGELISQRKVKIVNAVGVEIDKSKLLEVLKSDIFGIHQYIKNLKEKRISIEIDFMLVMCESLICYYVELQLLLVEQEIEQNIKNDLENWKKVKLSLYKELTGDKLHESICSWRNVLEKEVYAAYEGGRVTTITRELFNNLSYKFINHSTFPPKKLT